MWLKAAVAEEETARVRVEVTLPFAAGVTDVGEKVAVTPEGMPVALKVTAELNPFVLVMVMVLVPLLPRATVKVAGEAPIVKPPAGGALTVRTTVVVVVRLPEVPVMVTVAVPVVAVLLAVSVSTLLPVVGLVAKAAVTPLGRPEAASVTSPVKPPVGFTVMVLVPLLP